MLSRGTVPAKASSRSRRAQSVQLPEPGGCSLRIEIASETNSWFGQRSAQSGPVLTFEGYPRPGSISDIKAGLKTHDRAALKLGEHKKSERCENGGLVHPSFATGPID